MQATLETTKGINQISTALLNAEIPVSSIESTDIGFYVIWHNSRKLEDERKIRNTLKTIEGLGICQGESGFMASKGCFITVAL